MLDNQPINVTRIAYGLILACGLSLLGFGLYLEHAVGLLPCPLCIVQRIAFIAIMVVALVALLHAPRNFLGYVYSALIAVIAAAGGAIAGRQIWLQHLPEDQIPECGPGLEYMLETFPLAEALPMILSGSGECAEVQWRFLGLSIPEWSFLWFVIFCVAGVGLFVRHGLWRA